MSLNQNKHKALAEACWQSPSNIAVVKYWGKFDGQIPANPSLSFTLSQSFTETRVSVFEKVDQRVPFTFYFEGKPQPSFHPKIEKFLSATAGLFRWTKQYFFHIESRNTFPHSAGIASSASAMSALALCFCSLEQQLINKGISKKEFFNKASQAARLGSGSAARSVYGPAVSWGKAAHLPGSSNLFATPIANLHPQFQSLRDSILVISPHQKPVSSTDGHRLMHQNPYAQTRFAEALKNHEHLLNVLQTGNWEAFTLICEHEAMSLHAMMMLSGPGYFLFEGATLDAIRKIRQFRAETRVPIAFTLDAGPNIHLLYPADYENIVSEFLNNSFSTLFSERNIIFDAIGNGPVEQTVVE